MSVRWGVLGTGQIAGLFVTDLQHLGSEVVAVGSRTAQSARSFADRFGITDAYGDYQLLCQSSSVDAVYVTSPNPYHAEHALLALRAGKHVLLEKPFTMTMESAREVIDEAADRGLVVMEAMWTRFLPHMLRAREVVSEGTIGELRTVEANISQIFTSDPEHRINSLELGGGALFDLGVYAVALAVDFLGPPREWHAVVSPSSTGVDRQASIVLGFEHGAQAMVHTGLDHRGATRASIVGTLGRIDMDDAWYRASSLNVIDNSGTLIERFEPTVESRGMQFEALEFERLIAEGRLDSRIVPHEHTLAVLEVITDVRERFVASQRT